MYGLLPSMEIIAAVFVGGIFFIVSILLLRNRSSKANAEGSLSPDELDNDQVNPIPNKGDLPQGQSKQGFAKAKLKPKKDSQVVFQHNWLLCTLKGHGSDILDFDFSGNKKYVVSCAEDSSCFVWYTKDFSEKERKFAKVQVEYDRANKVCFSPDSTAFIASLARENKIRIFKLGKKEGSNSVVITQANDFPETYNVDTISMGIASTGKFIMTCHANTTIRLWGLKGESLASIDSGHMYNHHAAVSPCGRFVASCGFTPDVKLWEVCFDKSGQFKEVRRAFELKSHTAAVHSFAFNADSTKMATVSKDGTWKLWDVNIEYQRGQDPILLKTAKYSGNGASVLIALSPDARIVALAQGTSCSLYSTSTGSLEGQLIDMHTTDIKVVRFDFNSGNLVTAGDRRLHVLHNVPGYRAVIRELTDKLRLADNRTSKERLQQQINEARSALSAIGETEI